MNKTQEQIERLRTLQESYSDLVDEARNGAKEATLLAESAAIKEAIASAKPEIDTTELAKDATVKNLFGDLADKMSSIENVINRIQDSRIISGGNISGFVMADVNSDISPIDIIKNRSKVIEIHNDDFTSTQETFIFDNLKVLDSKGIMHLSDTVDAGWLDSLQKLIIPSCLEFGGARAVGKNLRVLDISGVKRIYGGNNTYYQGLYLIDVIVGNSVTSADFTEWKPTYAVSDTLDTLVESGEPFANNLEKFKYNLLHHLAENLPIVSKNTIYFNSIIKNIISSDEEISNAFTSRGWTVA